MLRSTAIAFAFSALVVAPAFAGEQLASGTQPQVAVFAPTNAAMTKKVTMSPLEAYSANVNPLAYMLEKVGPYDLEDAFRDPNGYALPGWNEIGNPASGGGDSASN